MGLQFNNVCSFNYSHLFHTAQQVRHYFIPEILSKGSQIFGRCKAVSKSVGNSFCTVQHTLHPGFKNLSKEITEPLNVEFSILDAPISGTTYYFLFSVLVNNTLQITERSSLKFSGKENLHCFEKSLNLM